MHCSNVSGVTVTLPSASILPLSTSISSVDSAVRASPLAKVAVAVSSSSGMCTCCPPKPRSSRSARASSDASSSVVSACSTNTLHRDSSAPLISNDGFSVVAPMRMMLPFSTNGKNASCCALLKRWISSTNTMVFSPKRWFSSARVMTARISRMPLVTAEKSINVARVVRAMMRASVVLPTPGGPQKIMEEIWSLSISRRSTLPSPSRCVCPTYSSSVRGRRRAASGCCAPRSSNSVPCSMFSLLCGICRARCR